MKRRGLLFCLFSTLVVASVGCRRSRAQGGTRADSIREDGALELRLLSLNVRYENAGDQDSKAWRQRVVGTVKMIRREQPDVFGVQEALHGQVADLRASLPEYEFSGVGRDDGRSAGEYSGIFYRRDRFEPDETDGGTFWLSDTPERVASKSWGNEFPRVAAWLRLLDRGTGRGFYVINTHWDHRNQPSRERAALLIARRIDGRKHPHEPVALIGDFNAIESNPGLIYLTGRRVNVAGTEQLWAGGLIDTYQLLHPAERNRRTLHFWSSRRDGLKVDHILVSRGARVEAAEIITQDQPQVSDHFPVISRVLFPLTR